MDADTDTDYDRHAYLPQGRPRPEQSAESLDPTKSPPRDAEVGGWVGGPDRSDDARRTPLGRKKAKN